MVLSFQTRRARKLVLLFSMLSIYTGAQRLVQIELPEKRQKLAHNAVQGTIRMLLTIMRENLVAIQIFWKKRSRELSCLPQLDVDNWDEESEWRSEKDISRVVAGKSRHGG